jgi:hypothetical protein
MHATEQAQRENARWPVIEVPAQHVGCRAAGKQILGSVRQQVSVEAAAEFAAGVGLQAKQARGPCRGCCVRLGTLHGRHYDRVT